MECDLNLIIISGTIKTTPHLMETNQGTIATFLLESKGDFEDTRATILLHQNKHIQEVRDYLYDIGDYVFIYGKLMSQVVLEKEQTIRRHYIKVIEIQRIMSNIDFKEKGVKL